MFKVTRILLRENVHFSARYSTKTRKQRSPLDWIEVQIKEYIKNGSAEPVDSLKSRLLGSTDFARDNFDAIFLRVCASLSAVDVGKRHFYKMTEGGREPGLAAAGRYMNLCGLDPTGCQDVDRALIDSLYRRIKQKYDGLLDSSTCEALTIGLSAVGRWREALVYLDKFDEEHGMQPSRKMFSAVVEGALCNSEETDGWQLMDRMGSLGKIPTSRLYEILSRPKSRLENFLFWHQKYDVTVLGEAVDIIVGASSNHFNATVTGVTYSGKCKACQRTLKRLTITEDEFNLLREAFLEPVLVGSNLFLKSRPDELRQFLHFLDDAGRVNIVLDGLNVAYSAKNQQSTNIAECAKMLRRVTEHFLNQGNKVMIVGRKHMLKWPKLHIDFLKKRCPVFFTEDVSADDPYLLYATMKSGLGTVFVSRDQMRSHKFRLKEPELTRIFSKWRQIHQRSLRYASADDHVSLLSPVPYEMNVQSSTDGSWHLPVTSDQLAHVPPHLVPSRTQWLCLSPKKYAAS